MSGYAETELPDWARPPGKTEIPADVRMPAWASADPKSRLVATPAEADFVLAIDVSNLAWRSAFAHPKLKTPTDEFSGGVFGTYSDILSKLDRLRSGKWCLAFCYDHRDATAARRRILPHYKTREPHDMENPVPKVEEALAPLTGLHIRAAEREADDAAAWIASRCGETPVLLYSNDKDFWAQIRPGVGVLSPTKGGFVGVADIREKFIVTENPRQIPLAKSVVSSDVGDTIHGVPGLIKKKIQPYFDLGVETVGQLYEALESNAYSGLSAKAAEKVRAHRDEAERNFRVVSAWIDGFTRESMRVERGDAAAVLQVAERYSLRHFADKLPVLTGAETSTAGAGFGQGWP